MTEENTSILTFYGALSAKPPGLIEQAVPVEGSVQGDSETQNQPSQGASHAAK